MLCPPTINPRRHPLLYSLKRTYSLDGYPDLVIAEDIKSKDPDKDLLEVIDYAEFTLTYKIQDNGPCVFIYDLDAPQTLKSILSAISDKGLTGTTLMMNNLDTTKLGRHITSKQIDPAMLLYEVEELGDIRLLSNPNLWCHQAVLFTPELYSIEVIDDTVFGGWHAETIRGKFISGKLGIAMNINKLDKEARDAASFYFNF